MKSSRKIFGLAKTASSSGAQGLTVARWCANKDAVTTGSFVNVAKKIVSNVEVFGTEVNVNTKDLLLSNYGWLLTQLQSVPTAKFLHRKRLDVITWSALGAKHIGVGFVEVKSGRTEKMLMHISKACLDV